MFDIFEALGGLEGLKLDEIEAANSFLMLPVARNSSKWSVWGQTVKKINKNKTKQTTHEQTQTKTSERTAWRCRRIKKARHGEEDRANCAVGEKHAMKNNNC